MTAILYLGTVPEGLTGAPATVQQLSASPLPEQADTVLAATTVRPDLVVIDPLDDWSAALGLAADIDQRYGITVALTGDLPAEHGLGAMQAGVRDVLPADASPARWVDLIARASRPRGAVANGDAAGPTSKVITIASPKGGVGKTTVASNVAVGLATQFPGQVVLVDLDIHFGDVATALNLDPSYTLTDIIAGPALRDALALKTYLTEHETGLFVVPGSDSPSASDTVTAAHIGPLLTLLSEQFRYVVVDTAPGLSEHVLAALDRTDQVVLVSSLDVPGIRGLRKEIDTLDELSMVVGARTVVLNFFDTSRGLTVADVEASIRAGVDVVVPLSSAVPISVNQGIPLLQGGSRDKAAARLGQLVDLLGERPARVRRGIFGGRRKEKVAR